MNMVLKKQLNMNGRYVNCMCLSLLLCSTLSLTACDNQPKAPATVANPATDANGSGSAHTSNVAAAGSDVDGATADGGTPVRYDVASWQVANDKPLQIDNAKEMQASLGKVKSTDDNSLDYASNKATKYRFMANDAPYLDLIDSKHYVEIGWYYANPTDSDSEKKTSINHAKKAHTLATQLMGKAGSDLIANMLNGQIIKNTQIDGQRVELAKCEFYSCMLVIGKSNH